MFTGRLRVLICIGAVWGTVAGACARSSSPDAGGDTALARDLALVSLKDTSRRGTAAATQPSPGQQRANVPAGSSRMAAGQPTSAGAPTSAPIPAVTDTSRATPAAPTKGARSRRGITGVAACASPRLADQNACLRAEVARNDVRLIRVYNAYRARLRSAPASRGGGTPAIEKLRVSERAWLVYRDQECRRRNWGKEGTIWAPKRAACLGELAAKRADELDRLLRSRR